MLPGPKRAWARPTKKARPKPKPKPKRKRSARPRPRAPRPRRSAREDPRAIPVFIIVRDRVTALRRLVARLERAGQRRIVLVDNSSTYPPLLEYFGQTPHRVVRTRSNEGPWSPWRSGLIAATRGRFVVTDPDMYPDDMCPDDFMYALCDALDLLAPSGVTKVGMGLRVDDLPDNPLAQQVRDWEARFWVRQLGTGPRGEAWWSAAIDSTFALYQPGHRYDGGGAKSVRLGQPYLVRCDAWYEDPSEISEEEKYFAARASRASTWGKTIRGLVAGRGIPSYP